MFLYPILHSFKTFVQKITQIFGYLGSIAMCLMAIIITVDVVGRFLFNKPLKGGTELVEELMVCVIFLMLAYVTEKERHVKVDVFISFMKRKIPRISSLINLIFDILVILILGLLTWKGYAGTIIAKGSGEVTDSLKIPHYPFHIVLTAGFAITFLSYLTNLTKRVYKITKKKGI